jgi:hypothetical protein
MKLAAFGLIVGYGIALLVSAGCGGGGPGSSTASSTLLPTDGVYSIQLEAATQKGLPNCTSALNGTVGYVASPPSLFECSGNNWCQIGCTTGNAGDVAYGANDTSGTKMLLACSGGTWAPVALPQGPQRGTRGRLERRGRRERPALRVSKDRKAMRERPERLVRGDRQERTERTEPQAHREPPERSVQPEPKGCKDRQAQTERTERTER